MIASNVAVFGGNAVSRRASLIKLWYFFSIIFGYFSKFINNDLIQPDADFFFGVLGVKFIVGQGISLTVSKFSHGFLQKDRQCIPMSQIEYLLASFG